LTTGLTYSTYVSQIAELAVVPSTDTDFQAILPQMITYAENRIYRDLDLLNTLTSNNAYSLTAGTDSFVIPQGTFITIQNINVLTPIGQNNPDSSTSTRNPLIPVSKEYLQFVYPSNTSAALPQYFAMYGGDSATQGNTSMVITFGPWPDMNYGLEIVGTVRPTSLSSTNTSTFLSTYLPDLFIWASMVYISAYQRNWGRMSDDPAQAMSYEGQYQALLNGAVSEENRKKFASVAWSSMAATPAATPSRG
jgi:hypothetical protein